LNQKSKKGANGDQISHNALGVKVLPSQGKEKTPDMEFANLSDLLNPFFPQMI
jgi:hypothetical protein